MVNIIISKVLLYYRITGNLRRLVEREYFVMKTFVGGCKINCEIHEGFFDPLKVSYYTV